MEKTPHYERGFYVFFDPIIWKRVTKEFVLQYDQLEVSQKTNAHWQYALLFATDVTLSLLLHLLLSSLPYDDLG